MLTKMNSKSGIVVLWCVIFILGGAAGWFGNCIYRSASADQAAGPQKESQPKKEKNDDKDAELEELVAGLVRELGLDAGQQEALKNILFETRLKYQELNKEFYPRYKVMRDESDDRIRSILRDDQKGLFEGMLK